MNLDNLIKWATGVVLAAAVAGHLGDLQLWIWKAQAKLLYESRTSTWGSPRFWPVDAHDSRQSPAVAPTGGHSNKSNLKFENNRLSANTGTKSL